jgi:hypothetical protein
MRSSPSQQEVHIPEFVELSKAAKGAIRRCIGSPAAAESLLSELDMALHSQSFMEQLFVRNPLPGVVRTESKRIETLACQLGELLSSTTAGILIARTCHYSPPHGQRFMQDSVSETQDAVSETQDAIGHLCHHLKQFSERISRMYPKGGRPHESAGHHLASTLYLAFLYVGLKPTATSPGEGVRSKRKRSSAAYERVLGIVLDQCGMKCADSSVHRFALATCRQPALRTLLESGKRFKPFWRFNNVIRA